MEEYIILAHSPSLNQTQRELQLMGQQPNNAGLAQQLADSFALRQQQLTGIQDWVGQIELVDPQYSARTL